MMPSSAVAEDVAITVMDGRPKSAPHYGRVSDKPVHQYARKKLPWIEAHEKAKHGQVIENAGKPDPIKSNMDGKPGNVASNESNLGPSAPGQPPAAVLTRHSVSTLGGDPSLRAIGSTPSLRKNKSVDKVRPMSLSSEPRRGISQPTTMQRAKAALLGKSKAVPPRLDDTSPSEYSTTFSTTDAEQVLPASPPSPPPERLLRKDPASYERLLSKSLAVSGQITHKTIRDRAQQWVKSQKSGNLDIVNPRSEKRTCKFDTAASDCTCSAKAPGMSAFPKPFEQSAAVVPRTVTQPPAVAYHPAFQGDASPSSPSAGRSATRLVRPPARTGTNNPKPPPRTAGKSSLFPMPTHMMESSSHSTDVPSHLRITTSSSSPLRPSPKPQAVHKAPAGPPTPAPFLGSMDPLVRSATALTNISPKATVKPQTVDDRAVPGPRRDLRREKRTLSKAVTGLENLMEEAIHAAEDASRGGRTDDVAAILDNAAEALRTTSSLPMLQKRACDAERQMRPLRLSEHESGPETDTDSTGMHSMVSSLGHSQEPSYETLPTLNTKSAQPSRQPLIADPYLTKEGKRPVSHRAKAKHRCSLEDSSDGNDSMRRTPPRLYQPPSADSIVKDFAYSRANKAAKTAQRARGSRSVSAAATSYGGHGAASDYYGDQGESVGNQPGVRASIAPDQKLRRNLTDAGFDVGETRRGFLTIPEMQRPQPVARRKQGDSARLQRERGAPEQEQAGRAVDDAEGGRHLRTERQRRRPAYHPHLSDYFENAYYRIHEPGHPSAKDLGTLTRSATTPDLGRKISSVTDERLSPRPLKNPFADPVPEKQRSPRNHISLRSNQDFSLGRYHRRQPIAREWHDARKRWTAMVVCGNTVFVGLIAGIYAGEVPKMQYQLFDKDHHVILGNVLLFVGLGLTTLIAWPLPLLHGRKPYTLVAFGIMIPLQFPQALAVSGYRDPTNPVFRVGLLVPRVFTGIALGFANINILPTLLDLFGCSLMSERPHQEIVTNDDVRRQGGGMGIWLGLWSFCFVGSLSIGFCVGACIISKLGPQWGFYIVVILLAFFMAINVLVPEPRRAPYRRSIAHYFSHEENKTKRRVARGEVKLHICNDGPKWWFEEVWAGLKLTTRMVLQPGFFILMCYIAWVYAQVTLVILLQGALLSRDYRWQSWKVGLACLALAIGALLATPMDKAGILSRARYKPERTDSMTMHAPRLTWSSHLMRRCLFTFLLPIAGVAYTLTATGPEMGMHWSAPTILSALVGFLSNLAIAECVGLIMETFDTCDLQPGVNQKHRLQSMAEDTKRRRTNYSSFPRVCAGFFAAQSLGFLLAAASTGVSGSLTRALGAQIAIAFVAGVLLVITFLFMLIMWRFRQVQVIPSGIWDKATKRGSIAWGAVAEEPAWKPVIVGNPSGKFRRINLLEMGSWTRWSEIRKLNHLMDRRRGKLPPPGLREKGG